MRCLLLLALLLPLTASAQPTEAGDSLLRAAHTTDLAKALLNPEWLAGLDDVPPQESFFASAHDAFVQATREALLRTSPDALTSEAFADPDIARVDSAARSVLSPSGWTDELVAVLSFMAPPSSLSLADSARVEAYLEASGLMEHLTQLKWFEITHPKSPLAETTAELLDLYTEDEMIGHQLDLMTYQFRTPIRYALRTLDPAAIELATAAYLSDDGEALVLAQIEGTAALEPYLDALLDWSASLMSAEEPPALTLPHTDG